MREIEVDHWIEHPPQPRELVLAWQPQASQANRADPDRIRWAVGCLTEDADGLVFDYFDGETFAARNLGRSFADLQAAGYAGYPAFDMKKRPAGGYRDRVLEAFLRRLPPPSRSDFAAYLAYFKLKPQTPLSPLALLAATEARLPSDGFSLIDPLDPAAQHVELVFEIAGFRHRSPCALKLGDSLSLAADPANSHDPDAVQVLYGELLVGYVNRLQARTVRQWLDTRELACSVARLNGSPEAPRAFAFLQVRPQHRSAAA